MSSLRPRLLVLGSGIAGLSFAVRAAEFADVRVVTKKEAAESNTNYAQGGIAAALGADDDPALHFRDTMEASAGLADPEAVRILVEEGPARVRELESLGVAFARSGDGFDLAREGGHSRRRIVHARDRTGREVEKALLAAAEARGVAIETFRFAVDLVVSDGRASGAILLEPNGRYSVEAADAVVLATGGAGRIYPTTTNPAIATGDGVAMALRAGARVRDMEFVQFHPTALYRPGPATFLISEAVRGEGAVLVDAEGRRFMDRYDPRGELAPRDVVARAIDAERKRTGAPCMYLDVRPIGPRFVERFPTITRVCRAVGIDPLAEPIPVVPAAHYFCGGVATDVFARTSIPGLYALGECASHGIHGANRLASNSLLEALVFAARAADDARETVARRSVSLPPPPVPQRAPRRGLAEAYADAIRRIMGEEVGLVRTAAGLARAVTALEGIRAGIARLFPHAAPERAWHETANMAEVACAVARAASARKVSIGLHFLADEDR